MPSLMLVGDISDLTSLLVCVEGVIFQALIITCLGMMPQIHALMNVELLIGFICDRLPF